MEERRPEPKEILYIPVREFTSIVRGIMSPEQIHALEQKIKGKEQQILDGVLRLCRSTPRYMPAGGWLKGERPADNWRTTTIVQRYRDQALGRLLSCQTPLPVPVRDCSP